MICVRNYCERFVSFLDALPIRLSSMLPPVADPESSGFWEKNRLRNAANLDTLRPFWLFDDEVADDT